ncbi:MAG TPA: VOC family protein [Vicinamibacterales bacterium]|nr:VOC family protein [Vicinamibacterales bacterium]
MKRVTGIGGIFFKSKDPKALGDEGCQVLEKTDDSEDGKFGWVRDPEGNKIELWEPPPGQ